MKANRLLGAILAAGLGVSVIGGAADALAEKKPKSGASAAPAADPPDAKKAITLSLPGLAWGQTPKQVATAIDKIFDDDYQVLYKATSPGVKMKALDAQLAEEKDQFRRSRIDFGKLPTGIDSTPLKPEYTYMNKETLMILTHKGRTTNFFFIQDKLWKVIDETAFDEGTPIGKTFADAVVKLATRYGVAGRVLPPDPAKQQFSTEVDWRDGSTHLRAIERSDKAFALGYVDRATESQLTSMRTNKPVDDNAIDPAVAAAMRKGGDDSGPPQQRGGDPKKNKK